MKKLLWLGCASMIIAGVAVAMGVTTSSSMPTQVFNWMVDNQLTRYTSVADFRPQDPIVRGEAAKFYAQYAQMVEMKSGADTVCKFNDIANYDNSLTAYIISSCQLGLFKGYQGGFHPRDNITYAQALAVTIRSIDGYLDESGPVRYQQYLDRGKEIGLLDNVSVTNRDGEYITRAQLAERLYMTDQYRQAQSNNNEGIVYETEVDGAQDCTSYEQFDDKQKLCYYQCDTELECSQIQDQIDQELEGWTDALTNEYRQIHDSTTPENTDFDAQYRVAAGEKITIAQGNDDATYQSLWKTISDLSPNTISDKHVDSFAVYRKDDDTTAYVVDENGDDKRLIAINLTVYDTISVQEQKASLIHELGHIITLNQEQMNQSGSCTTYNTDEGCLKSDSYLNQFVARFWRGLKSPAYDANTYVTEYATTSPEEDIAESFAFFVLSSKFNDNSVKDAKMNLFNQYPEMMAIRTSMRAHLAQSVVRARKQ